MSNHFRCDVSRRQVPLWGLAALLVLGGVAQAAPFRPGAAVLGFQNVSIYSGHLLGRRAADQLALDLGATGAWRVIDRPQTDRAVQQRDLRPPYAAGLLQELGHALGADMIFTGAIQKLEVDPKLGRIRLTVFIEGIDQPSGQSALATVQTAEVRPDATAPQPTDVLIGQALAQACGLAAKLAAAGTGAATAVADPGNQDVVQLQRPPEEQAKMGQRFLLYRAVPEGGAHVPGKLIGTLMVTECGAETCKAKVLARAGDIHTADIAVSICGGGGSP